VIGSPLGRIYGNALFQLATEKGVLPEIIEEFDAFARAWRAEPRLQAFLGSPNMLTEDKLSLIHKVAGGQPSPLFQNFLSVLVNKGRIDQLTQIHFAFGETVDETRGIVRGVVHTAVPADDGLIREIESLLSKRTGKHITLEAQTDPAILGGVVINVKDRLFDASVRTQLNLLRDRLLSQDN
jgi:F-type H+-transporting ATPase subunit delta